MSATTASVSGKLILPDGAAPPAGSFVQLDLKNYGIAQPQVSGVVVYPQKVFNLSSSDGTWSGSLYRNDAISVNGTFPTYWAMTYFTPSGPAYAAKYLTVAQDVADLDTLTALNPSVVLVAPSQPLVGGQSASLAVPLPLSTWTLIHNFGTQSVVAQCYDSNWHQIIPDTATATDNNTFTATFVLPQTGFMVCFNVGNWTPSITNPNYVVQNPSSSQTIAGDYPFTFGGSINTKRLEGIRFADQFAGADLGAKLTAAIADLPATGGEVNCYGFAGTTQTVSSTVTIPKSVTARFHPATLVQAGASSTNLFILEPDAVIDGLTFDASNQPSYSGIVIQNDTAVQYSVTTNNPLGSTQVRNCQTTKACQSVSTGTFIKLNSTSNTTGIYQFTLQNVRANGLQNGLLLTSSNSGFVNGIRVIDLVCHQCINGIRFTTGTSGQLNSNTFLYSCEAGGDGTNTAAYGILFDGLTGTSIATGNRFIGDLWDYNVTGTPFAQTTTASRANYFLGEIDGTPTDVNSGNYWLVQPNQNSFKASSVLVTFGSYGSPITINASNGQLNLDSSGNNFVNTDGANSVYIKNNGGNTYFYSGGGAGTEVARINSSGLIAKYGSINTVSGGIPAEYASVDLTAQGAAISATTLYAVPASGAGMYRISYVASITRAGSVSSTLGGANGFQITYTDANDSVVKTSLAGPTSAANTIATLISGSIVVNAKASTNIQYLIGYTDGGGTTMQYNLHVKLEAL